MAGGRSRALQVAAGLRVEYAAAVLLLAVACFVPYPEPAEVVYDAQGLPDCDASFTDEQVCSSISHWSNSEVEGFTDGTTGNIPVRWIGTEVQPAFCSDDGTAAEAWALEVAPDDGGSHRLYGTDARWFDLRRYDAEGAFVRIDRVMRCAFVTDQAASPPGMTSVDPLMTLTGALAATPEDFYPMAREMARWRRGLFPVQAVVAFGEAQAESRTLRVCAIRCGECDDVIGPTRNYTAVLETQDWVYDPTAATVSFAVEDTREVECQAKF